MRLSIVALALLGLATAAHAGNEVGDDSQWVGPDGQTVTFDVTSTALVNDVTVTATDSAGTSSGVIGSPGPTNTVATPTTDGTPNIGTPGSEGETYRVNPATGKPQYRTAGGDWVNMKKKLKRGRRISKVSEALMHWQTPAEEITSMPLVSATAPTPKRTALSNR